MAMFAKVVAESTDRSIEKRFGAEFWDVCATNIWWHLGVRGSPGKRECRVFRLPGTGQAEDCSYVTIWGIPQMRGCLSEHDG